MTTDTAFALILTLLAGLATGLGGALVLLTKRDNPRVLAASLGFSAGVMIYISFGELLPVARDVARGDVGTWAGSWELAGAFLVGAGVAALIDVLVPTLENPHDALLLEEARELRDTQRLRRLGLMSAVAIAIHNFPEGAATFFAALTDEQIGASVALAIGIHNVPEGIAVAIPIYYATGNRSRAFTYALLSGLSEPLGGVLGYAVFGPFLTGWGLAIAYAAVAGIMVFISLDQLIPNAKRYGHGHESVYGLLIGMFIMALTLVAWGHG
jgi:ZIP family zinc transporter